MSGGKLRHIGVLEHREIAAMPIARLDDVSCDKIDRLAQPARLGESGHTGRWLREKKTPVDFAKKRVFEIGSNGSVIHSATSATPALPRRPQPSSRTSPPRKIPFALAFSPHWPIVRHAPYRRATRG